MTTVDAVHGVARAAAARGTAMGLSSFASHPVEEVTAVNDKVHFQIYWLGGRDEMRATTVAMQSRWRQFVHSHDPGFDPYSLGFATQVFDAHFPTGNT